ncbi:MAG: hypothetical protein WBW53_18195 [Terriglobales bacterium]
MSDYKELSCQHPACRFPVCENRTGNADLSGPLRRLTRIAFMLGLLAILIPGAGVVPAFASVPGLPYLKDDILTSLAPAPDGGFWGQIQDSYSDWTPTPPGYTQLYDGAPRYENIHHAGLITWVPGTNGYWVITESGHIYSRGGAPHLCKADSLSTCSSFSSGPYSNLTAAAATPSGHGLWAVGRNGKVWTAGDAQSYGDTTFDDSVPTGIVPTPSGNGYYIVVANGGVHTFGDAEFFGSTGGNPPGGRNITGMATSIDANGHVNGYWLVGQDGGVFAFGSAPFYGSSGGNDSVVTSIISFPSPDPSTDPETIGYAWINAAGNLSMCTRDRPCGGTPTVPAP